MGFNYGFYRVKNHGCKLSLEQYNMIKRYNEYCSSDWAKKYYNTAEDYAAYGFDNIQLPDETILKKFENDGEIFKIVQEWGEEGEYFWEPLKDMFEINYYNRRFNKREIIKILSYAIEELREDDFIPVTITHAFLKEDSHGNRYNYHSFACDGIIALDENDNEHRIETDDDDNIESGLFISGNKWFDKDKHEVFTLLRDAMITILTEVDFDTEDIFFIIEK